MTSKLYLPFQKLNILDGISKVKSNWLRRVLVGITLVFYFAIVTYFGPILILLSILAVQIKCFDEIINIAYKNINNICGIPYFRTLHWYFVLAANYLCYGEVFREHFYVYIKKYQLLGMLFAYHRFISFCLYFSAIVLFVLALVRKEALRDQFGLWACTHCLLIVVVLQSYAAIQNIFHGIIWFAFPVAIVVVNDIFAYVFGKLLGKTPLIQVSPKKTAEGFIYGAIATMIFGLAMAYTELHLLPHWFCPIKYIETSSSITLSTECDFNIQDSSNFWSNVHPFMFHALNMILFASIIAPFGGFFASGFKRAFGVKDFSNLFPGHGGLTDRFDCHFLMSTFVNVYITTFVKSVDVEEVFKKVLFLDDESQLKFYYLLRGSLSGNLSNSST